MKYIILITAIALVTGCKYSDKVRRAERKINRLAIKYPELTTPTKTFTIDTTVFEGFNFDTTAAFNPGDTFTSSNGRATVKTSVNPDCDTIYQSVEVKPDTIIQEVPCDCPPRVTVDERSTLWSRIYAGILGFVIGFAVMLFLIIYLKR